MATPSRIDEILEGMERDQKLAQALKDRILGEEFSMLPAAVAQNQGLIITLMERQVELSGATITAMEAVVPAIGQIGERTAAALEAHNLEVSELREKSQKTLVVLAQTQADVKQLQTDVRRTDERLDRGFGTNYESKVSWNIRSILGQHAGVRNSRVLKGPNLRTDLDFETQVENAEAAGAITEEESDELWLLDLIVSGTLRGTQEGVYVAVEVSITANDDDVNRAADRVETLRKVTGGPVMAMVIATRMDESCREPAARRGVETAIHPE